METILEICCNDIESVIAARRGGADRIELCSALELDGLTPSLGLIREAVRIMAPLPVNVLIRPRPGDFVYSAEEMAVIRKDIAAAVEAGAAGIVFGSLTSAGEIDEKTSGELRALFPDIPFTFHRAFDKVKSPEESLEKVIAMGYDRILTSGLAPDALAGGDCLKMLVEKAAGRIIILAGCGITPANVAEIISRSGVREVHASAKKRLGSDPSDSRLVTSENIVSEIKNRYHEKI